MLLQIRAAWLLQNGADVITNWGSYYKLVQPLLQLGQFYYKLGQLLQIGAVITNWSITGLTNKILWIKN